MKFIILWSLVGLLFMGISVSAQGRNYPDGTNKLIKTRIRHESILAQQESNIDLHCNVTSLENIIVEWSKGDRVLTINSTTVINDIRFQTTIIDQRNGFQDYRLRILFVKEPDKGVYTCTARHFHETENITIVLETLDVSAVIMNPNQTVKVGFPLRLTCKIENSLEKPKYIYWYHGDRVINADLHGGSTVRIGEKGTDLIFPKTNASHAGNYSCVPSNARQASAFITIQEEDNIRKNGCVTCYIQDHIFNMVLLIMTMLGAYVTTMQIV